MRAMDQRAGGPVRPSARHQRGADGSDPVIDMHMHAMRADDQGPPPLGVCQGDVQPPPEAGRPSADTFMA